MQAGAACSEEDVQPKDDFGLAFSNSISSSAVGDDHVADVDNSFVVPDTEHNECEDCNHVLESAIPHNYEMSSYLSTLFGLFKVHSSIVSNKLLTDLVTLFQLQLFLRWTEMKF